MNATDYIRAYVLKKTRHNGETYYKRDFDNGDKIIHIELHKMDLINECYLTKQVYYPNKYNDETGICGVMGKTKFVFGITNDIFNNLDEERGLR